MFGNNVAAIKSSFSKMVDKLSAIEQKEKVKLDKARKEVERATVEIAEAGAFKSNLQGLLGTKITEEDLDTQGTSEEHF